MKKMLLSALALMGVAAANAQSTMTVDLGSDNATFDLTNVSKITFADNGSMNVFDALGVSKTYELDTVRKITFAGDYTAIDDTKTEPASQLEFAFDGDGIIVNGLDARAVALVSSASGAVVARQTVENGSRVETNSLSRGVYVLTVAGKSLKFVK